MTSQYTLQEQSKRSHRNSKSLNGFLIIVMIFFLVVILENSSAGQVYTQATLNDQGVVQLPKNAPIESHYEFDLSKIKFANDEEMIEFLSNKSGSDYFVRANTETKKAILVIDRSQHANWTVDQWNQHLQARTSEKSIKK